MFRALHSCLVTAALSVAAACSSATQPAAGGVQLRPDRLTFVRAADGTATVTYTVINTAATTVQLTNGCGARLLPATERRDGSTWTPYAGGICLAIYPIGPLPLAAGAVRADTTALRDAGDYRLVLGTGHGPVRSTAFTVQ